MKAAIQRLHGKKAADKFTPETLKLLWDEFYRSENDLKKADKQVLLHIRLPGGLVEALTKPDNAGEY